MSDSQELSVDPMENAAIGETYTIEETKTLHEVNYTPDVYFGSDRFADDIEVTSVELVELEDGMQGIEVTWNSEVTKRLPRRWDYHKGAVTESEKKRKSRRKWIARAATALSIAIPFGIALLIHNWMMGEIAGEMTINGEPMTPPTTLETLSVLLPVVLLTALLVYAISGGMPPITPRGGRR
jgi:hypothetical protein